MRIVAFTAAFGKTAAPHVQPIEPDVPLICFTDKSKLKVRGYDVRRVSLPLASPQLNAKYVKIMAHRMLPDADWAIWFDAAVVFKTGRLTNIVRQAGEALIAIHRHAVRSCVYDEAETCMQAGLDDPHRIDAQMTRYREAGHPRGAGLWENGILVRRLSDPRMVALNEAWWSEILQGSVRDQLSLPVMLNRLGLAVQPLPGSVYDDEFASVMPSPVSRPTRAKSRKSTPTSDETAPSDLFDDAFYLASTNRPESFGVVVACRLSNRWVAEVLHRPLAGFEGPRFRVFATAGGRGGETAPVVEDPWHVRHGSRPLGHLEDQVPVLGALELGIEAADLLDQGATEDAEVAGVHLGPHPLRRPVRLEEGRAVVAGAVDLVFVGVDVVALRIGA